MCIDGFDLGQSDDFVESGDYYIGDDEIVEVSNPIVKTRHPISGPVRPLNKEDYADIFLENFN